jgi:hypothetical protein
MTHPMTPDDAFQLTLMSLAETALNIMLDRSKPKSRRANRIVAAKVQLDAIDATYTGWLADDWIKRSQKFNQTLEVMLCTLLKEYQHAYTREFKKENTNGKED